LIIVKQKPVEPETTEIIGLETPNTTEGTITENTNFNFGPVSNSNEENIAENVNQEEELVNPETSTNENPAVTLGSKDKKEFTVQEKSLLGIAGISLLSLSAGLIVSKRKNTEIFIYSNGTKEYTGKARLDIKNAEINISKNLEEPKLKEKSFEKVELVFNEKIGEKMIDKELNIKFGENSVKTKITKEENKYIANI
jgi:LPXTG-motif cell wall-anchored protein